MSKKLAANETITPQSLWGKPLTLLSGAKDAPEKKDSRKMRQDDDDVMEDEDDIDVDAELAEADADAELDDAELVDDDVVADFDDEPAADEEPDYDDDEDVPATDEEEEVVTAVADDVEEESGDTEETVAHNEEDDNSMAEKMSLSDHVRAEISRRQKSGASMRGKDIVEALGKRNITVSPAQVSQLLKKAGLGGKARKKVATAEAGGEEKSRTAMRAKTRNAAPAKPAPKPAENRQAMKAQPKAATAGGFRVPMDQLQAAAAFVDACGGSFKSAERILTAAAQLSQTFGE